MEQGPTRAVLLGTCSVYRPIPGQDINRYVPLFTTTVLLEIAVPPITAGLTKHPPLTASLASVNRKNTDEKFLLQKLMISYIFPTSSIIF